MNDLHMHDMNAYDLYWLLLTGDISTDFPWAPWLPSKVPKGCDWILPGCFGSKNTKNIAKSEVGDSRGRPVASILICDSRPRIRCPTGLKFGWSSTENDIVFPKSFQSQLAGGQAKWRSERKGSSKGLGSGTVWRLVWHGRLAARECLKSNTAWSQGLLIQQSSFPNLQAPSISKQWCWANVGAVFDPKPLSFCAASALLGRPFRRSQGAMGARTHTQSEYSRSFNMSIQIRICNYYHIWSLPPWMTLV